jgi:hypothetical protein
MNPQGECHARSPFPDVVDRHASFSVNVFTGAWYCFQSQRGGGYLQFRSIMGAEDFDPTTGRAVPDYAATERALLLEFHLVRPVDPVWLAACQTALAADLTLQLELGRHKPWSLEGMRAVGLGWDAGTQRFVIPIHDRRGRLINAKLYRPGGEPKMLWHVPGYEGNFLWPHAGWSEGSVILVEGEPDALTLRQFGFPAISGVLGAGHMVPDGEWWRGRHVWLWHDPDPAGAEGEGTAITRMRDLAASIHICATPDWDGRPRGADASDYVMHLLHLEYGVEQVQRAITAVLEAAVEVETPHLVFDSEPTEMTFRDAMSGDNLNARIAFEARVTARSSIRHILPTIIQGICPATGHNFCNRCPMRDQFHGQARLTTDPRSADALALIEISAERQRDLLMKQHGIANGCPDWHYIIIGARDVETVILNEVIGAGDAPDSTSTERARRTAYIILERGTALEENRDYGLEGFVYPHPQSQAGVFWLDRHAPRAHRHERFEADPGELETLIQFRPASNEPIMDKLLDVAADLEASVTSIYGRPDLHVAYRTVWHSALHFHFAGQLIKRGWLECLVLGDTRCGKSIAFQRLAEHLGAGVLIDCKLNSPAGILGTVTQSPGGDWFVVAGLLPQQHGSIVAFDEFQAQHAGDRSPSMIETLSSTRSEGVVRIQKAAAGEFRACVRQIWLANPGVGKLLSELNETGAELIQRLIPQPEDIARFDFALAVSQTDVAPDVINSLRQKTTPQYPREAARLLLAWTWSRTEEQIIFSPAAETACVRAARALVSVYDPTIPLVEVADQRLRIAKIALSIAAQTYSTNDGVHLLVGPEHVETAMTLLRWWYNKPALGYDRYSAHARAGRVLRDEPAVRTLFDVTVAPHGARLAEELLRLDEFTARSFKSLVPMPSLFETTVIQQLYAQNAIKLVARGRRESYERTGAFTAWLQAYTRPGGHA